MSLLPKHRGLRFVFIRICGVVLVFVFWIGLFRSVFGVFGFGLG